MHFYCLQFDFLVLYVWCICAHVNNRIQLVFNRDRATAEECLKHPWLQSQEIDSADEKEKNTASSIPEPVSTAVSTQHSDEDVEEESIPTEELIVMAAYTLGQCRQSSDKENLTPEQKAISKRFKFEEPFPGLQEVPGEFIY